MRTEEKTREEGEEKKKKKRKGVKKRLGKLPEKILPGSRGTFCNICNRETLRIVLPNFDRLQVGLFCPECDRLLIDRFKARGGQVIKKPGLGPNVPLDSKGFKENSYGPWRSKGGDRDIGTRSGKGEELLAYVFTGEVKTKVKKLRKRKKISKKKLPRRYYHKSKKEIAQLFAPKPPKKPKEKLKK